MNSKHSMIDEWRAQFDQSIIDAAISQWRRCLRTCTCTQYAFAIFVPKFGTTSSINSDNYEPKQLQKLIIQLKTMFRFIVC